MSEDQILYHYTTNDTFLKIIESEALRLSSLDGANDHKEGTWVLELLYNQLQSMPSLPLQPIKNLVNTYRHQTIGLACCMSKNGDLLSQWRGYADDGKGVSIGLNRSAISLGWQNFTSKRLGFELDVEYRKDEHINFVSSLAEDFQTLVLDDDGIVQQIDIVKGLEISQKIMREMYRYKNPAFKEEDEVRFLCYLSLPFSEGAPVPNKYLWSEYVKQQPRVDMLTPFLDWKLEELKSSLVRVMLGPKNNTSVMQLEYWLEQRGFTNVSVRRSNASYR